MEGVWRQAVLRGKSSAKHPCPLCRLRIREDFETGNLEKPHSLLTGAPTASTEGQQSSGSDEIICEVLLSKSSNTCKHPNQTHLMGVEATQGQPGVRAGEGTASSPAENVKFIVGWGEGREDLWKHRRQRQKQRRWWRNPCGKGWDTRSMLLPGICCCTGSDLHARITKFPPHNRCSFCKGRSLWKWD